MTKRAGYLYLALFGALAAALAVAWLVIRPDRAIRVATGVVSHTLCSGVFVSGLDPDRLFAEALEPNPGLKRLSKRLRYGVDRTRRQVVVTWAGRFTSRAVYRDGRGCMLVYAPETKDVVACPQASREQLPPTPAPAKSNTETSIEVEPKSQPLETALDHAFAETSGPPHRWVKAVVILHNGKLVAEHYAPSYRASTPIYGYSLAKSVVNAMLGILVRQGKLSVGQLAPVAEWHDPRDARRAITIDELLRMTSGLALDESESGFDPVSRMLFLEPDMAGFAERASLEAPPGSIWKYTSGNTLILSRIIRDTVGGRAEDVIEFARHELFEPLGISTVTMEFDATGTPVGSQGMLLSARDWARFGMLYLNDGMVDGKRILPANWVAYSTAPTLNSAYGAGFWTNRGTNEDARWRVRLGMPSVSFYGSGNFGQRIVIVPSAGLVIVRMGLTHSPDFDMRGLVRLVKEAVAAVG